MPVDQCVSVSRVELCKKCLIEVGVSSTSPQTEDFICFTCFSLSASESTMKKIAGSEIQRLMQTLEDGH